MDIDYKKRVREALLDALGFAPSQNKLAKRLAVSSPVLTHIKKEEWEKVSHEMVLNIGSQLGVTLETWTTVKTQAYQYVTGLLEVAYDETVNFLVAGEAGLGKTVACKHFAATHPGVYYLECEDYWTKKDLYQNMLRVMGVDYAGYTTSELIRLIISELRMKEKSLLIFDQADKLNHKIGFYVTLYNALHDKCGFFITGVPALKKRYHTLSALDRQHYKEVMSRGGKKFLEIPKPNAADIAMICQANGITDEEVIAEIAKDSMQDLRRTNKLIKQYHIRNRS